MQSRSLLISISSLHSNVIVEQAFVLTKELENAVDSAPKGQVIDRRESLWPARPRPRLRPEGPGILAPVAGPSWPIDVARRGTPAIR